MIDSRNNASPALRCAWCGATADERGEVCSSRSDRDLLLHYYSGVNRHCNQQAWQRRRGLFDRADAVLGKEPAL